MSGDAPTCCRRNPARPGHARPMSRQQCSGLSLALRRLIEPSLAPPVLDGALCRGRHELFDGVRLREPAGEAKARHAAALELCGRCPAFEACSTWLAGLPADHRPGGVVAGRVYVSYPRPAAVSL